MRYGCDMTKSNLVEQVAGSTGHSKKEAEQLVDAVLSHIAGSLAKGEKIDLRGFGSFQVSSKAERQGRNPKTGEAITIPARKVAVFKPAKELATKVNGADAAEDSDDDLSAELADSSAKVHGDKLEH